MSFATSPPIHLILHGGDAASGQQPPHQVLEVQSRFFIRVMAGFSNRILYETAPIPLETVRFPLPLHELNDDPVFLQIYIAQLLSSINIGAAASEVIAGQVASYITQMTEENRETAFHAVAVVDNIQLSRTPPFSVLFPVQPRLGGNGSAMVDETVIVDEASPAKEKSEPNGEEEWGDCCICLDELNCKDEKRDVVKIPCGHVYHEPCIFNWLVNCNSCPLCRKPLPLEDSH